MKQIKQLHFYALDKKGLLCTVLLAPNSKDGSEIELWKHKLFPEGTTIMEVMKVMYLAYNWDNGKEINTQDGEEKRQND